ncbi:DUF6262 family protein [Bacillus thuringiensis]|nr:DUF6262 family protein [Bacillus thuringiensis]MED2784090.1 DUF6262 family protein [Bacillus thuringiensis]
METYDRLAHVKQLHEMRKKSTFQKADKAIQRLIRARKNINFNSVASEAGVSKATLYNNQELRERVETLRDQQAQSPTRQQIKREMNETNKDALIESLKRRIKKVEEENKQLREQLKFAYANIYKDI